MSRALFPLRTSLSQANRKAVPSLPKACKPVLPRIHADLHLENQVGVHNAPSRNPTRQLIGTGISPIKGENFIGAGN